MKTGELTYRNRELIATNVLTEFKDQPDQAWIEENGFIYSENSNCPETAEYPSSNIYHHKSGNKTLFDIVVDASGKYFYVIVENDADYLWFIRDFNFLFSDRGVEDVVVSMSLDIDQIKRLLAQRFGINIDS